MNAQFVIKTILDLADPDIAKHSQRFFKTAKGQYGAGDVFVGVRVPKLRKIAQSFKNLPLSEVKILLDNEVHEIRQTALFILVLQYKSCKESKQKKKEIFDFYVNNITRVNNWDLVDLSASEIVGAYLLETNKPDFLYVLAKKNNLWQQRIAVIATFAFIRVNKFEPTLNLAELFLTHQHDLIHKAVGWTLRDVGKKDLHVLIKFLKKNYARMPRTMLRYAIEKFPESLRQDFLKGTI